MTTTSARPVRSSLRSLTRHLSSRVLDRVLRLPAPTATYTVSRVHIPMRDGVELLADHYAPDTEPVGTLLVRGPYGRGFPFSLIFGALYAARGYHVVVQSVRGTFGSAGTFVPMVHEVDDGADTVAWLRRQPWFTGRFAMIGLSYLGFTQWAILQDPPPELAAAVITVGPHDLSASSWGTGSFTLNDFLGWSYLVARQEEPGRIRAGLRQLRAQRNVIRAAGELPLGAAGRALLGDGAPWYESWLEHPDRADPFWERLRCRDALDRVQVPVLLIGGWQDLFLRQTLEQYRHLRDRAVDVALTIGPWTHTQMLTKGLSTVTQESLAWLDAHLGGASGIRRDPGARIFINGDGWRELPDWPPPTHAHVLYLQPGGGLAHTPPSAAAPASFRFDPTNPTPTIGGPLLSPDSGYRNDSRLARRDDVLTFTGDVLTEDLCVHGNPVIELAHTSDNPYVDVFVRVSQVDARGRSVNVSEGYRRLRHAPQNISIELDAIAHRFRAGSRIRVFIAGGWHPRYARNLGTDEPPVSGTQLKPATHTVHFGTSRLLLPVQAD
ncbi:CocE/NonD family hydrolase [Mycobacterium shimoidei]|uniref:CocE/NonD family hydrolase n=1 Tax=Mycobacterium shimoidei TaxID=29313 RepID=UPI0008485F42|nr:CocE/NonD family hydrolase [Mycobacterium shimoidei]MCV7261318.1 CocE/NonD family hydrolase [Mycobacterium shimoidei]ODR07652.1 hydrolase [Mycobacterium shimoidei]ORW83181.1 hydrolase [Mycobacterium shimoidei]